MEIQNVEAKRFFQPSLHPGEVEAIILSTELSAKLLLLDDLTARKYAKAMGITITGTLGVLLSLKGKGLIDAVKPVMRKLQDVDMYIDNKLYNDVLSLAGE